MAKAFTVASWNVEHFKNKKDRVDRVCAFLKKQNPDIFALYEVESADVYFAMMDTFPTHSFHITEGDQSQEIFVGVRRTMPSFFTQKLEFKSGNTYLRPGALLTVRVSGKDFQLLFLHTKSSADPIGLGLRDDMFARAIKFKRLLDKLAGGVGKANFMFLGDLNTMGMTYPYKKSIDFETELKKLDAAAKRVKMRRLSKNKPNTWWNGGTTFGPSNIDHVLLSDHLTVKQSQGTDIVVHGWPEFDDEAKQKEWISNYSDHGLLFFQVEK